MQYRDRLFIRGPQKVVRLFGVEYCFKETAMKRKTIAVIFGGCSSEYEVSLMSASSVIRNLDKEKYNVVTLGITREGKWLKYGGTAQGIEDDTWMNHASCLRALISPDRSTRGILVLENGGVTTIKIDAAFPVLHGKNGEDGTVQGLLELAGIPCVGCGMIGSAVCMDKDVAHRLARAAGVRTPKSVVCCGADEEELPQLTRALKFPLFVKPAHAGSSLGVTKVENAEGLAAAVGAALAYDRKVIIEEAIEGFEVGCAILGNDRLTIGEVDEIELSKGFFDYTEKYTLKTSRIYMPARVTPKTAERIKRTAARVYRALGCRGMARVDMFLTPKRGIVFNEVNTIPGFTPHSRYPAMMSGIGLSFTEILDELIRLAVEE